MDFFWDFLAPKYWSDYMPLLHTTDQNDQSYVVQQFLKAEAEKRGHIQKKKGAWIYAAFAYGGAITCYLHHREKYSVAVMYEELCSNPKGSLEKVFEVLKNYKYLN